MSGKGREYKSDNKKLITRLEQSKAYYEKNNDILHTNYQLKMEQTDKEKEQLNGIIADLEHHNQQLQTVVSCKTAEIKEYLMRVENQCFDRSQILDENERLDDIICELQRKNKELSESTATTMFNQAQQFTQRGL